MAIAFRSVVYGATGSWEHLMLVEAARTLCGREPEHINPGLIMRLPNPNAPRANDYCYGCLRSGRRLLGEPD